ncbi:T9SS type A sorting domain-containing protein [Chryseobacterium sp. B21-037]|uniref:T9SS type A sorting domain-containing protein n=1 Tax=unclassified Chryseobacterium TaxID=2593645 RepID=UPI00235A42BC|nr:MULTISPECIES: T9SS type A sorting domain-containing protein [unclassified Chryseobacterium]MDC8103053.1 T9SS type A sorting domain-containing protein [Chryseobacterium sp. B21-037]MDQ1802602.1 T9SS type A sorting domain-containing protein [Chryseobacterium sp. CKR4-1]
MAKFLLSCFLIVSMALNAQIDLGAGSTDVGTAPISSYYGYSYVQQIYPKQEINANAAGNITGLKFYLDPSMSLANSSDWVVYLGHTSKSGFTSDTDWIPVSQLTQVYAGTITNANGVVEVTFTTPFPYNNTDNLVVAAEENSPGYDNNDEAMYVYSGAANSTLFYKNDSNNPDPASPPAGDLADYKSVITFLGLTANPIAACPVITYPSNNSTFIPLSPTINWNNTSGATSYKVSIGTTPGGTDVVNQQSVATNSFTPAAPLSANTNYYLRVVSVSAAGESSGCTEITFKTSPPAPSNDDCAGAITLTVNPDLNCGAVTAGYTLGATDSGLIPDPCYGDPDDDVWFKFVATATTHKISLLNVVSVGTTNDDDTYFQVFSGACGTLSSILCSDDTSSVLTGLTVGDTYYVRVYSYFDTGSNQSFDICVGTMPPPPANDDCSGALTASAFPYTYVQSDGGGATNNGGFVTVCSDSMNDGTWFTFTGDGATFDITVTMPAGSDFDPQIGVYSGTCGSLACVDTVDNNGSGGTETLSIPTQPGTTYYVNVGNYSGFTDNMEGTFTINIAKNNLGTSEVAGNKKVISVYPNPFSDILNISDIANVKSVTVTDISGRWIKTIDNLGPVIHLADIQSGLYLVTLTMKDGSKQTIKAIKK